MKSRDVDINDIPQTVWDEAESGLRHYFVPLYAQRKFGGRQDLRLIGSGTLVSAGERSYILTAAHVWNEIATADKLHLHLLTGNATVAILCSHITPKLIWNPQSQEEWGPDLALIELPTPQASTLKSRKSFLPFESQFADFLENPPKFEKTVWVAHGIVEEFSNTTTNQENRTFDLDINVQAFVSSVTQSHDRDDFDYYDIGADPWMPGIPTSFGGVSGGGLWQLNLSVSDSGQFSWDGKRHFRGVAFWESLPPEGRRIIRCHGPRSIFERLANEFGLSPIFYSWSPILAF